GVTRTSSVEDVNRAFTVAAKEWHPDRVPAGLEQLAPLFSQVFARLQHAKVVLSDPSERLQYATNPRGSGHMGAAANAAAQSGEAKLEAMKADALLKKHDLAGAEQHLRRAVQLAPQHVGYQVELIALVAKKPETNKDKLRDLANELGKWLQKDESCERAYFERALIRKRLDDPRGAQADFAKAAELNPRNLEAAREVRLHAMRTEKKPEEPSGIGGFFKRLVKR